MDTVNLTVAIPKALRDKLKKLAVDRGLSVKDLVAKCLEEVVNGKA